MSFVRHVKNDFRAPPISEANLERLREAKQKAEEYLEESKKDSKLKPMD